MAPLRVDDDLSIADRSHLVELVRREHARTGRRPLSDQLWLELTHATTAPIVIEAPGAEGAIVGFAQLSRRGSHWTVELVVDGTGGSRSGGLREELLRAAVGLATARDATRVEWWAFDPDQDTAAVASATGMRELRRLHQMRRRLDADDPRLRPPTDVATRPFIPGTDEAAWLEVNNLAFRGHAEQGDWDMNALALRMHEAWFDPLGFLLHERDGRLAGFCWTKVHDDERPPAGEIYVVGVHPDFRGLGLGTALTVAGLSSMIARGLTEALLYVAADNAAAMRMYRSLGFTVSSTDVAFGLDLVR